MTYPQKLALTSPTGGGRSVGIVRSRTKATEFLFLFRWHLYQKDTVGRPNYGTIFVLNRLLNIYVSCSVSAFGHLIIYFLIVPLIFKRPHFPSLCTPVTSELMTHRKNCTS